ncbi:trypsin-like serine peptidase [Cupriavidus sp. CuC1]|uniref:trypsin-like serine peptidase n=1 Tax=Cupriavidus sp. CuC1 TaxID=3373131 RepID=UPI0037D0B7AD
MWVASIATALVLSSAPAAQAAGLFDITGGAFKTLEMMGEVKRTQAIEKASGTAALVNAPNVTPLPESNGPVARNPTTPIVASGAGGGSSTALRDTVAKQTDLQRSALSGSILLQIKELEAQLQRRLAIKPRTAEISTEINALNEAITVKRQAYDFAVGNSASVSAAVAESYAATSNPYFLMCKDQFWTPNDPLKWGARIRQAGDSLTRLGRSIGVIEVGGRPAGTGTVVGKQYVLTNLHVAKQIANYDPVTKQWSTLPDTKITFDKEYALGTNDNCVTPNAPRSYYINAVFDVASNGDDLAILLTSTDSEYPKPVVFADRANEDYAGNMLVAVIGYPGPPRDMIIAEQIEYFRTPTTKTPQFGYKRVSEGFTGAEAVTVDGIFVHKANTSGGNSGSPVIDLADGAPIGVHVGGVDRFEDDLGYNKALVSGRVKRLLNESGLLGGGQ